MGWSEDKAKMKAFFKCVAKTLAGKDCWEPVYDLSLIHI